MSKAEKRNLTLLIALLSAFPPLSIDMYLPAIPLLEDLWHEPLTTINLTLVAFFLGYCVSLLFYGPLSDKFGRRPLLLVGISIYMLSSLLAALVDNAVSLIVLRAFQGIGAASGSALALAMTKDLFDGEERKKILATIAIIMPLAPMLAPTFGGWIMLCLSWHWIFVAQAVIGLVAFVGVFRMKESLIEFSSSKIHQVGKIYLQLLKNQKYIILVLLFSLSSLVHFSFIGSAADIYIRRFGLSEHVFGYFFALNGLSIMSGAFTSRRIRNLISTKTLLTVSFIGILISSLVMVSQLFSGPWKITIPMMIASFCFGLNRPASNHLILEQVHSHAGSASSLMVFCNFVVGAFSMWMIAFNWSDKIMTIGIVGLVSSVTILSVWLGINQIFFKKVTLRN
ncbi:MAG: DHA1 family bicyclomycin/chloramphenicol resistance-like MFS transporter [Sulfurimonas sp.]|jgi:DHA1 family bicyclomycin/chloramphenicol resistance-like MFS transporter